MTITRPWQLLTNSYKSKSNSAKHYTETPVPAIFLPTAISGIAVTVWDSGARECWPCSSGGLKLHHAMTNKLYFF
ncbi:hypothetical protein HQN90_12915 [Paenibacillus alba]|nr:hypothetical protein [Paenibacillus alba]